jgi:hypothetical protein
MHRDMARGWQRHPLRNMGSRAIGLPDDQEVIDAQSRTAQHLDFLPRARVVRVVNPHKRRDLFAGTMSLVRLAPARRTWPRPSVWLASRGTAGA